MTESFAIYSIYRKSSILAMKTTSAICLQLFTCQKRFFRIGPTHLRPVNLSYSILNLNSNKDGGTNPPSMVVMHGLFGSKKNFDSLAKVFSKNAGLQVVSLDARNHGDSEHSPDMSYELMAEDVFELLRRLGLEDSVLLGHSMGGKIAMTLALTHPEIVRGLVVADMVPDRSVTADTSYFSRMIERLRTVDLDSLQEINVVAARKVASQKMAEVVEDQRVRDFLLTNLIQRKGKICWRINLEAIGNHYESLMSFPAFDGRQFPGRTIFIGGSKSNMITDKHRPVIKKFFPNSEVVHVAGSGHWVHADNPQEFSDLVLKFVQSLPK